MLLIDKIKSNVSCTLDFVPLSLCPQQPWDGARPSCAGRGAEVSLHPAVRTAAAEHGTAVCAAPSLQSVERKTYSEKPRTLSFFALSVACVVTNVSKPAASLLKQLSNSVVCNVSR